MLTLWIRGLFSLDSRPQCANSLHHIQNNTFSFLRKREKREKWRDRKTTKLIIRTGVWALRRPKHFGNDINECKKDKLTYKLKRGYLAAKHRPTAPAYVSFLVLMKTLPENYARKHDGFGKETDEEHCELSPRREKRGKQPRCQSLWGNT